MIVEAHYPLNVVKYLEEFENLEQVKEKMYNECLLLSEETLSELYADNMIPHFGSTGNYLASFPMPLPNSWHIPLNKDNCSPFRLAEEAKQMVQARIDTVQAIFDKALTAPR